MFQIPAGLMQAGGQAGQGLMSGSTFGSGIEGSAPNLAQRPEGNMFSPIQDDADFMFRMNSGEFDGMDSNPEMSRGVMEYINAPASSGRGKLDTSASDHQLGLSAYKDMSETNKATPLGGLMAMAQTGQRQQQFRPQQLQQGLMNPWGG